MSSQAPHPTGLIANSGIELLTFGAPNGLTVSIMLEELKAAYNKDYVFQLINLMEGAHKQPWYTAICPNGRIPAIVDHDRGDFAVFESSAILTYLMRFYDPAHKFSFDDPDDASRAEQWLAFQNGGLSPMQNKAAFFFRYAPERVPYPTQHFIGETERHYSVLNTRLEGREYLVGPGGGKYSFADIANFAIVNVSSFSGVDLKKPEFENLYRWWQRIEARPAVRAGLAVPMPSPVVNTAWEKAVKEDQKIGEADAELTRLADEAKKQYNYELKKV